MLNDYRSDNNYGNIEPLFKRLLDNDVDCYLVKSRSGTYIRVRNENNDYGASIIEEYTNRLQGNIRFELALIKLDWNNFGIVQHEAITNDVLRNLTSDEVFETIDKISCL